MADPFKLVITGAFNTGKTTFIRSLSDVAVVDTDRSTSLSEEKKVKNTTTVAMDYGRINVGDRVIQLFGTPGQDRFDFMRDILAKDMDGFLVLVDINEPTTIDAAASLVARFKEFGDVPFGVVANKSDLGHSGSYDDLRQQLSLPAHVNVYSCIATERTSVQNIVHQFLEAAEQ